jgi:hypothetical protein
MQAVKSRRQLAPRAGAVTPHQLASNHTPTLSTHALLLQDNSGELDYTFKGLFVKGLKTGKGTYVFEDGRHCECCSRVATGLLWRRHRRRCRLQRWYRVLWH